MHRYSLLAAIICCIGLVLWHWLIIPVISPAIPKNHSLSIPVFSVDNLYNEELGQYEGEITSKSTFSYEVVYSSDAILTIQGIFDVRTLDDDPIISITRLYGIDSRTGQHVSGYGDRNRSGYLFAPPNLEKGTPFTYWHINYDAPAEMHFVQEEFLHGVTVFKYKTTYPNTRIDQTADLAHLPGVPETRGVELEPTLTLWIEPTTGRMVSYEDVTTAYYYDIQSGERLSPWNTFSNSVTTEGIETLAGHIQVLHFTRFLQHILVPGVLLLASGAFFFVSLVNTKQRTRVFRHLNSIPYAELLLWSVSVGSVIVMIGWFFEIEELKSIVPGLVTMKFSTALSFFLSSLVCHYARVVAKQYSSVALIILPLCSLLLILFMGTLTASSILGISSGIESLFVEESPNAVHTVAPGRPSIGTMISFILIAALGIGALFRYTQLSRLWYSFLGFTLISLATIAILGYIFNTPVLYFEVAHISTAMAFHTALFFIALGIGIATIPLHYQNNTH